MLLTAVEFETIMDDASKCGHGDIAWTDDEDHSPASEFRAEVGSTAGWPLFVYGRYNPLAETLTYTLILRTVGRIYGLDLGKEHHNSECNQVGEKHKHRWTELYRDKQAYEPDDITAPASNPVVVWKEFCTEACIRHEGVLRDPPAWQEEMFQ